MSDIRSAIGKAFGALSPGGETSPGAPSSDAPPAAARPWPTELRVSKDRRTLTVTYDDGVSFDLSAEYLRVASPSAEVQGHSPAQRKTVPGKIDVEIMQIDPLGNYAAKIVFDDMHSTGIYGWDYLRKLGEEREERFASYLAELQEKGLSREPATRVTR
ncbi:MAG: DUF971 domain-containing protein [Salinarimonadaceae bacterium]|nr:MAG: DUF971 domain-containing protein [Salinarimonadaceae bacterium]